MNHGQCDEYQEQREPRIAAEKPDGERVFRAGDFDGRLAAPVVC
jgi:hypothetical protein